MVAPANRRLKRKQPERKKKMDFQDAQSIITGSGSSSLVAMAAKNLVKYDGSPDVISFQNWKKKLEQFFILARINNELEKVTLGKMQLVGKAYTSSDVLPDQSWDVFTSSLYKDCIPADMRRILIAKLKNVKQRSSAEEYRRQFNEILCCLDITDDEAQRTFISRLKPMVQTLVSYQLSVQENPSLSLTQTIAVQIDASLYAHKSGTTLPRFMPNRDQFRNQREPMVIDNLNSIQNKPIYHRVRSSGNFYNKGNRSHKFECFKCGQEGHYARNCPKGRDSTN